MLLGRVTQYRLDSVSPWRSEDIVFQDLDDSLQELLARTLPESLEQQVEINFAAPDDQLQPSSGASLMINLFLYGVRENLELRTQEWTYQSLNRGENGQHVKPYTSRTVPPVRVDCSYLITAWSSQSASQIRDEHHLLGAVMKALLRYHTLPAEFLVGDFQNQALPLPTATLQTSQVQSFSDFWQALGGKPKAALNYTVTISVPVDEPQDLAAAVERRDLTFKHYRSGHSQSSE